jgi:NAD-dependent dihydropyrimidine dehydrogenase PreA subunit
MAAQIARIDPARCTGCGRCISACALRLIAFDTRDGKKRAVLQAPARCTGCGDCAARCPVDAISLADAHPGRRSPQ